MRVSVLQAAGELLVEARPDPVPGPHEVLVEVGGDEMTLPVGRIQQREPTLTGTFRYARTWPAAVKPVVRPGS